jgi:hypothetical protein
MPGTCPSGRPGAERSSDRPIQRRSEFVERRTRGGRLRAHHHHRTRRQHRQPGTQLLPEPAPHEVAADGRTDPLPDHDGSPCGSDEIPAPDGRISVANGSIGGIGFGGQQLHEDRAAARAAAAGGHEPMVRPAPDPRLGGQHRIRRTATRGPCADDPRGWLVRHASASGA